MAYPIQLRLEIADEACAAIRHHAYKITDDPMIARKLDIRFSRIETFQQFKDRMQEPWNWHGFTSFCGLQPETAQRVRALAFKLKMPELVRVADAHDAMREDWEERRDPRGAGHVFIDEYDGACT